MGRVDKGVKCSVEGCDNDAVRSISLENYKRSGVNLKLKEGTKRVYLCREHYKEYKKNYRRNVWRVERFTR
ncbi:MAG: hypothetical protein ACP5IE_09305 [Infirmifilum sp.]|jgi:hypothetical protein|uniref:hypothetical protein n=1 Tax=Infirmifilum uzonense TaxID=1550241 RepID=UPI000A43D88F|nr:hypothetical protein [Infirmifilum uzonense]